MELKHRARWNARLRRPAWYLQPVVVIVIKSLRQSTSESIRSVSNESPSGQKFDQTRTCDAPNCSLKFEVSMPLIRVLSVGLDPFLLRKRSLLLHSAGHNVASSSSLKDAVNQLRTSNVDLVLLCRTIPAIDRERLTCLIRASGFFLPIISVAETKDQRDKFPDATLDEEDEAHFLWHVQRIAAKAAKRTPTHVSSSARRMA